MKRLAEKNTLERPQSLGRQMSRLFGRILIIAPLLTVASCVTLDELSQSGTSGTISKNAAPPNESQTLSLKGVSLLRENKFTEASKVFNQALKLDARNSYLQLL
ncbi:MAG: hypothetical protein ACPGPC_17815, partial [Alphaproteobacteria bacterium]